jgi:hypothetical protein
MFVRLITLSLMLTPHVAWTFDPFSIIAAGSATVSTVQTISGATRETAEIAGSLGAISDLASEIGDADPDSGPDKMVQKIQEVERMALEVGYTREEINDIIGNSRDSQARLSTTLNKLTRSIRLSKRLLGLAGVSTKKAAEVSQLEQARGQNDEKKILADIYSHLVNQDLEAKREELKTRKEIVVNVTKLRDFARGIAPGGNLNLFPLQSTVIKKAIEAYRAYSGMLLMLLGVILVGRLIYYQVSLSPPEKYTDLIKDAFVCYFLMIVFPIVYSHMAEYSEAISVQLSHTLKVNTPDTVEPAKLLGRTMPWWLSIDVIRLAAYVIVYGLFNLVLAGLIAFGPVAVL